MKNIFQIGLILMVGSTVFACSNRNLIKSQGELEDLRQKHAAVSQELEYMRMTWASDTTELSNKINVLCGRLDSLIDENNELAAISPTGLIRQVDSLNVEIAFLEEEWAQSLSQLDSLSNSLSIKQGQLNSLYKLPGNKALRIETKEGTYDAFVVDTRTTDIRFFWKNKQGRPMLSLDSLKREVVDSCTELIFATNAGMYLKDQSPQGLYVEKGVELVPIDRRKGLYGNFYLEPNGVFAIDSAGLGKIILTEAYDTLVSRYLQYATQSGPMVVIEGEINSYFNPESTSKYIRSGVGVIDEHTLVFLISNQPVIFYDFAAVFKEHFQCRDALYLDGAISRMYLPQLGRFQTGGHFGPMIGILKNLNDK